MARMRYIGLGHLSKVNPVCEITTFHKANIQPRVAEKLLVALLCAAICCGSIIIPSIWLAILIILQVILPHYHLTWRRLSIVCLGSCPSQHQVVFILLLLEILQAIFPIPSCLFLEFLLERSFGSLQIRTGVPHINLTRGSSLSIPHVHSVNCFPFCIDHGIGPNQLQLVELVHVLGPVVLHQQHTEGEVNFINHQLTCRGICTEVWVHSVHLHNRL
mmetsp:Transcript_9155/g.11391  ORF Transcript_9155/g.11391 Transcript_9155/m.11391 type:complete len:217 (+) Transcript_9155:826-1476(+)